MRAPSARARTRSTITTNLDDGALWSALAVRPINAEAIRARKEMWDVGRRGIALAAVVCVLTFLTVPAIYLFEAVPAPKRRRNRPVEPLPFGSARRSLLRTPEYDLTPSTGAYLILCSLEMIMCLYQFWGGRLRRNPPLRSACAAPVAQPDRAPAF